MKIKMFQLDAFSSNLFSGNPAAVCILSEWLSDDLLLSIASENNLSETAFLNLSTDPIGIRWFSPKREVDLCGHATLASARVLIDQSKFKDFEEIVFESKRGLLKAQKEGDLIFLDFPSDKPQVIENVFSNNLFAYAPQRVIKGTDDYLFIFDQEEKIETINANYEEVRKLDSRGAIVSAIDSEGNIVSLCFYFTWNFLHMFSSPYFATMRGGVYPAPHPAKEYSSVSHEAKLILSVLVQRRCARVRVRVCACARVLVCVQAACSRAPRSRCSCSSACSSRSPSCRSSSPARRGCGATCCRACARTSPRRVGMLGAPGRGVTAPASWSAAACHGGSSATARAS